jgi:SAM-dependent methyltransferase
LCQYSSGNITDLEECGMESEEKNRWNARYTDRPDSWTQPDEFLTRMYDQFLLDHAAGVALDLAGGAGRNSIFLVERGWRVDLVDVSEVALDLAREKARWVKASTGDGTLNAKAVDLNTVADLGQDQYNLIIVFYFLRRELFPALIAALKPGGVLIYRTYTIDRMNVPGGPTDAAYLLQANELREAFDSLDILHYNETKSGKAAAELVAKKV